MRVGIIGRGRFGQSMALLLERAGEGAVRVWSGDHTCLPPEADLYWITVPDQHIHTVAQALAARLRNAGRAVPPMLHAAGSRGPEALGLPEQGVLHPLMTFPGPQYGLPDLRGVRAAVDGTPGAVALAERLAEILGLQPIRLRLSGAGAGQAGQAGGSARYHAAATMASSHAAAVFLAAAEELARLGLEPAEARAALLPLARESLERAARYGGAALTGPTVRGDRATEQAHIDVLGTEAAERYRLIRALIQRLAGGA